MTPARSLRRSVVLGLWAAGMLVAPALALQPLVFEAVPGWAEDNQAEALVPFRTSCAALNSKPQPSAPKLPPDARLDKACAAALALPPNVDRATARAFFERWFTPALVDTHGRFTGYYEPEMHGSLTPTKKFRAPLLAFPKGSIPDPFPDRAAIEAGAFAGQGLELVWLDPIDAFFVHIQGSSRVRLPDGKAIRVNFAGRNGYPFTPLGRVLVERGVMTREQASMQSIRAWLAANPKQAPDLMRANRSYIFFRRDEGRADHEGPIGGQGVPVTGGRSLAVDDTIWPYGLPVFMDVPLPDANGRVKPVRRLMIAQDTGAAIRGIARADIFIGTGHAAGQIAGRIRNDGRFIVLVPRAEPAR